jgi:hypothetical protein
MDKLGVAGHLSLPLAATYIGSIAGMRSLYAGGWVTALEVEFFSSKRSLTLIGSGELILRENPD